MWPLMSPSLVTFSDLEGHFCWLKPSYLILTDLGKYSLCYPRCLYTYDLVWVYSFKHRLCDKYRI